MVARRNRKTATVMTAQAARAVEDCDALIVGSGPCGIAAALLLEKRGWKNIHLVERMPTPTYYDKERAFMYGIDARWVHIHMFNVSFQLASVYTA